MEKQFVLLQRLKNQRPDALAVIGGQHKNTQQNALAWAAPIPGNGTGANDGLIGFKHIHVGAFCQGAHFLFGITGGELLHGGKAIIFYIHFEKVADDEVVDTTGVRFPKPPGGNRHP